jgi:hypothetical protein
MYQSEVFGSFQEVYFFFDTYKLYWFFAKESAINIGFDSVWNYITYAIILSIV